MLKIGMQEETCLLSRTLMSTGIKEVRARSASQEGRIVTVFLKEYAGSRMIARLAVMRLSEMTPEDQSG